MGGLFNSQKTSQATDPVVQEAFNLYKSQLNPLTGTLSNSINSALANPVYGGQTYAGLDPLQTAYYNNAGMLGGLANGYAGGALSGANTNYNNTADYGQRLNAFGNYLQDPNAGMNFANNLANSPMTQGLVDASTRDITRNLFNNQLPALNRTAMGSGNTNSTRAGVAEGLMRSQAAENIGDMSANIRNNMFNTGLNQFNANVGQQANAINSIMNGNMNAMAGMNNAMNFGTNANAMLSGAGGFMQNYNQGAMDDAAKQFYLAQTRPFDLASQYLGVFNPLSSFNGGAGVGKSYEAQGGLSKAGQLLNVIGTGATLFCWVAREVYGPHSYSWLIYRHWMFSRAPKWFFNLYSRYGARFAHYISDKPKAKRIIKHFMDKVVVKYGGANGAF